MRDFLKPNVIVSKCLGFEACRYNGQVIRDDFVKSLEKHVNYVPVCPEVAIGLGIPRFPVRIVASDSVSLIQHSTNTNLTNVMNDFSERFLSELKDVDGFILKNRSPSCGINDVKVYRLAERPVSLGKSSGFFGGKVLARFAGLAIEDEGRLKSYTIREHFLTKLFSLTSFRGVRKSDKMSELVRFHTNNKFLLMSYGQKDLRILGNIVANHERKDPVQVMQDYEKAIRNTMENPPKATNRINVLMHIFGYFSKELSGEEKRFFSETVELYREGRIPFISALTMLRSWAIRFGDDYLMYQSYFEPYPDDLMELSDAGRKLEL